MRIAVVDDDTIMVSAVTRLFPGHDIAAFSGAKAVLDIVAVGERFDVIITDLAMPGLKGTDLHATLSAIAPDQAARMIYITGGDLPADNVPVLKKPFDPTLLVDLVERIGRRGGWM
jgi:FixJ family two-component response regulator